MPQKIEKDVHSGLAASDRPWEHGGSSVRAVLIGIAVSLLALGVVGGAAGTLLWVGVLKGHSVLAVLVAAVLPLCFALGSYCGTGWTIPRGSMWIGALIPVLTMVVLALLALLFVAPLADFRSVAIALGWSEAPNVGTRPTEVLVRISEVAADDTVFGLVGPAARQAIEAAVFLVVVLISLVLAGIMAAMLNRNSGRERGVASISILAVGVALLTNLMWPSVLAMGGAVIDFDQSGGPEIGVNLTEVVNHPESMWNRSVTVSAQVSRVPGPHAAFIGNDALLVGDTLLILSEPELEEQVLHTSSAYRGITSGDVVQVTGTVRRYDPLALETELGIALDEEVVGQYQGPSVLVVEAIDPDVPNATAAGDPELPSGSGGYDYGVTIDDIVNHPDSHIGLTVTVSGEVEETILTPHAFVLDDNGLLAISVDPRPELFVEATAYVTGEVGVFDLKAVEQQSGVDLDNATLAPFEGQPFILVDSVKLVD